MTLDTWIEHHQPTLPVANNPIKRIMTQLIEGLTFLHFREFVHGALSANQIAILDPYSENIVAKISKFPTQLIGNNI